MKFVLPLQTRQNLSSEVTKKTVSIQNLNSDEQFLDMPKQPF